MPPPSWIRPLLTTASLLRLIPITVVLLVGVTLSLWTHRLLTEHQDRITQTYQAINATKDLLIDLDDAETGQRGFLLSGYARYLQPYARALRRQDAMAGVVGVLAAGQADQTARVAMLMGLVRRKMAELQAAITIRRMSGAGAATAAMLAGTDRTTMDAIRRAIGRITHAEMAMLATRDAEVSGDERRAQLVALAVGLASILTRVGVELLLARRERASLAAATRS